MLWYIKRSTVRRNFYIITIIQKSDHIRKKNEWIIVKTIDLLFRPETKSCF